MKHDIDATDYFNLTGEQIDKILDLYDEGNEGQERAEEEAKRLGLSQDKFDELCRWFGRTDDYGDEPDTDDGDDYFDDHDIYGGGSYIGGDSDLMDEW